MLTIEYIAQKLKENFIFHNFTIKDSGSSKIIIIDGKNELNIPNETLAKYSQSSATWFNSIFAAVGKRFSNSKIVSLYKDEMEKDIDQEE